MTVLASAGGRHDRSRSDGGGGSARIIVREPSRRRLRWLIAEVPEVKSCQRRRWMRREPGAAVDVDADGVPEVEVVPAPPLDAWGAGGAAVDALTPMEIALPEAEVVPAPPLDAWGRVGRRR
ncbi:MAG: hypothetical protein H6514_19945 [Acidimicrobiaceae bacterium]|nr:hypothetical protein [Acidimicrobiaceae bacterium]